MTNDEIEKIAERVSQLVLQGILQGSEITEVNEDIEQQLLTQLASAMTKLDYALQKEDYYNCGKLKKEILLIEKKLKNL